MGKNPFLPLLHLSLSLAADFLTGWGWLFFSWFCCYCCWYCFVSVYTYTPAKLVGFYILSRKKQNKTKLQNKQNLTILSRNENFCQRLNVNVSPPDPHVCIQTEKFRLKGFQGTMTLGDWDTAHSDILTKNLSMPILSPVMMNEAVLIDSGLICLMKKFLTKHSIWLWHSHVRCFYSHL